MVERDNDKKKLLKTSVTIAELKKDLPEKGLSLKEFLDKIGDKGKYILIIILTAPFIIPVSIPGSSTPFGLLIILIELSNLINRELYLPNKVAKYQLSYSNILKIFETLEKVMGYVEKIVKPRLTIVTTNIVFLRLKSVFIMLLSFLLLLPLPIPFTDFVPAVGILMLSISTLEKDGLLMIAGYLMTLIAVGYFISVGSLGIEGIKFALSYLGITL